MTVGARGGWRSGLVALLLVAGLGGCATTAVAGPAAPPPTASVNDPTAPAAMDLQERLDELVGQVTAGREDTEVPGLAGLSIDTGRAALDLWWVGDPPLRVRRLVAAPPAGLAVVVHPARYDLAETVRAVDRLMGRYRVLHAGSPEADGSGVEVETTVAGRRTLPSPARLSRQAGMPVRVVISEPPVPA